MGWCCHLALCLWLILFHLSLDIHGQLRSLKEQAVSSKRSLFVPGGHWYLTVPFQQEYRGGVVDRVLREREREREVNDVKFFFIKN
jgi:hypothetical protein